MSQDWSHHAVFRYLRKYPLNQRTKYVSTKINTEWCFNLRIPSGIVKESPYSWFITSVFASMTVLYFDLKKKSAFLINFSTLSYTNFLRSILYVKSNFAFRINNFSRNYVVLQDKIFTRYLVSIFSVMLLQL